MRGVRTALTELLGIRHPLVGFSRSPGVVAEVSRAGGLGVLAATAWGPDELDAQLTWIERRCGGAPYGVDLLVPATSVEGTPDDLVASLRAQVPAEHLAFVADLLAAHGLSADRYRAGLGAADGTVGALAPTGVDGLLDVIVDHGVALVANALGPAPARLVERGHAAGAVVAGLVGSARHAVKQLDAGVDVLVAQGTEAGGHTGTIATTVLTPEVVAVAAGAPVLAAGGIASGAQMAAALVLGADGAWCGSVWLGSEEDISAASLKRKLLAAGSGDTVRSRARTGKHARQLRSAWHDAWEGSGAPEPLGMPLQLLLAKDAFALVDEAAADGDPGATALQSFFVGQVVGSLRELRPTAAIVEEMVAGCRFALRRAAALAGTDAAP